jgi:hypothetical protein
MKEETNFFFACLGAMALIVIVPFVGVVIDAFVFLHLWGWFAVPLFHLRALTFWQAAGTTLLVSFVTTSRSRGKEEDDKGKIVIQMTTANLVIPALTLLIGWIVSGLI